MKNVFIAGVSGTGKTTIAQRLKEKGIQSISIDEVPELCFWINNSTGKKVECEAKLDREFINTHVWMCDTEKLKELLKKSNGLVVLGHAENENDFIPLFDKLLLLQCRPETFIKRILERKDNNFGKDETAQKYLLDTYEEYENSMINKGAIPINVEESLEGVVSAIIDEIQK